jgi:hypothetical protein
MIMIIVNRDVRGTRKPIGDHRDPTTDAAAMLFGLLPMTCCLPEIHSLHRSVDFVGDLATVAMVSQCCCCSPGVEMVLWDRIPAWTC